MRVRRHLLAVGLLASLGIGGCQSSPGGGREEMTAVAVGAPPVALVASPGGRIVVSVNYPATVSLIDVRARRETARVEARLTSSGDRLVDAALDARTRTAWIVSSGGEIFSLDLDRQVLRRRFRTDEPLHLTAVAWDEGRSRALVGDLRGGIHALDGGALHEVLAFDRSIADIEVHGDSLYFTAAEGGMGPTSSSFGAYDLAASGWLFDQDFEDHALGEMSVAGERIWLAEFGNSRLLEFTDRGEPLATRYLSRDTVGPMGRELGTNAGVRAPRFAIDRVAASPARLVIASAEESERRILEYRRAAGGFATLPAVQYSVPAPCTALCLLGTWGLAAGVGDDVILIPSEAAQPFARRAAPSD